MIGERYVSTGISLKHGYSGNGRDGWAATLKFQDAGFCDDDVTVGSISTEGELHTRYYVRGDSEAALATVIDVLIRDAEKLGITLGVHGVGPSLYAEGDGEDPEHPMPAGWRSLLKRQSDRLGWEFPYRVEDA